MTQSLIADALTLTRGAASRLSAAGVASARTDAELLMCHVLGTARGLLLFATVTAEDAARYDELVTRRCARVPLAHLTGTAPFRHVQLQVGPGVFVPRPETEVVAGAVIDELRARACGGELCADPGATGAQVVDLCTGSGAIAVAVASEVRGVRVLAVERDPQAARWARRNAASYPGVTVLEADIRDVPAELDSRVDVVVANPPYLPEGTPVEPEVAGGDPSLALWGGPDGLSLMPAVISVAARLLLPGGLLVIEHDDTHGMSVPALVHELGGWRQITGHRDLTGRARFVTARRQGSDG